MRAMILAAGRGQRMGALTEATPKPLLKAGNRMLIEYNIDALKKAGISEIVINVSYFKEQIVAALGDGSRYGVSIQYSIEEDRLETGGGIVKALPLLGNTPFIVVSSDIVTDYPIHELMNKPLQMAHLILVKNPDFHPRGDFCLSEKNEVYIGQQNNFTFANLGIYHPDLFLGCQPEYRKLAELWKPAMDAGKISGEYYDGLWYNIGTPQDLQAFESA
ncbi:MAG TPA: nucleotidyltransferase family protein [Gammaproteobacteria bacterium]|nr:nucleotidyltransferase family protein [Gammaproteobacteria bacterium]